MIANEPVTTPTSKSLPLSGPVTYRGMTGSVAPTESSPSAVTKKIPMKAVRAGEIREVGRFTA